MTALEKLYLDPKEVPDNHCVRWRVSLEFLKDVAVPKPEWKILELGWRTIFTDAIIEALGVTVENTTFDLRTASGWASVPDNSLDLIICMEVIEHMPDPVTDPAEFLPTTEFFYRGSKECLRQCHAKLKPGGRIFITTPNLNSTVSLGRWINYNTTYSWEPHPREMGFRTACQLTKDAGLHIELATTRDPYLYFKTEGERQLIRFLNDSVHHIGADRANRGEVTFIMARKNP